MTRPLPPVDLRADRRNTGRTSARGPSLDTSRAARAWVESRFRALVDAGASERTAAALLAHYAIETANGRAEWNYNLGNVRWYAAPQRWFPLRGSDDPAGGGAYLSLASLASGARAMVRQASIGGYRAAWARLNAGGSETEWYKDVMLAGWHPYSDRGLQEYARRLAWVRGVLGLAPAPSSSAPLPWATDNELASSSSVHRDRPRHDGSMPPPYRGRSRSAGSSSSSSGGALALFALLAWALLRGRA